MPDTLPPTAQSFIDLALGEDGSTYVFGGEVPPDATDFEAGDCSEFVQWDCSRHGIRGCPDGSWYQVRWCRYNGLLIPVNEAIKTKAALLFHFSGDPFHGGRPSTAHVAISLGNGKTIEARSTRLGVGSWSAYNRGWTYAGLIPGLDYGDDMAELSPEAQRYFEAQYQRTKTVPTYAQAACDKAIAGNFLVAGTETQLIPRFDLMVWLDRLGALDDFHIDESGELQRTNNDVAALRAKVDRLATAGGDGLPSSFKATITRIP